MIINEVVFFMTLSETYVNNGGFGTDVQKLYKILTMLIDAICKALNP